MLLTYKSKTTICQGKRLVGPVTKATRIRRFSVDVYIDIDCGNFDDLGH